MHVIHCAIFANHIAVYSNSVVFFFRTQCITEMHVKAHFVV